MILDLPAIFVAVTLTIDDERHARAICLLDLTKLSPKPNLFQLYLFQLY